MNFTDLKLKQHREYVVICRHEPYTISDLDYSDRTLSTIENVRFYSNEWYIEVFP